MSEVLVTGGSGYIGSWCVLALLANGHTVRDLNKEPAVRAMLRAGGAPENAQLTVLKWSYPPGTDCCAFSGPRARPA